MRLCIGEGFMFRNMPFEKSLSEISRIGFDSLELRWGTRYDANTKDDEVKNLKVMIKKHGLEVAALMGGGALASLDEKLRRQTLDTDKRQIQIDDTLEFR